MTLKNLPQEPDFEASMKRCSAVFDHLIHLRSADYRKYEEMVRNLKAIKDGRGGSGLLANLNEVEADSVLEQLEEHQGSSRAEVERILRNRSGMDDGFMGDESRFIPYDDAVRSGELDPTYRR